MAAAVLEFEQNFFDALDRGMEEQLRRFRADCAAGVPRVGWKIGLTTGPAQRKYGLSAPAVGRLHGHRTYDSGARIPLDAGARVRAEAEIALRVDREIDAQSDIADARNAIAGISPAIELIDLNMPAADITTILGHSLFHEAVVFGPEIGTDVLFSEASLWPVGRRNSKCVRTPEPSMIPSDLPALVLLVARTLGRYGEKVLPGDRIISGSYITPLVVEPGDLIEIDFGRIGRVAAGTCRADEDARAS